MARYLPQGSDAKGGSPRSPAPAPGQSSATADRLAQLESSLDDVRQKSFSAIEKMIESNMREIERVHVTLENRRASEVGTLVRVDELNELKDSIEQIARKWADKR